METLFSFVIIIVLILLNGMFVAAEFAIIGVRPSRIQQLAEEGNRTAARLRNVIQRPAQVDRYIATAQLGITLASLGLGMYGEPVIAHLLEPPLHDIFGLEGDIVHTISFLAGLGIITYLHVVVGEMVPKTLALQNAERTVLTLATPMVLMQTVFSFAITGLNKIGLLTLRLMGVPSPDKGSRLHTPDELELIVSDSVVGGMMAQEDQQLLSNIFDFAELRISQIMVPRPKVEAVSVTMSEQALLQLMITSPHNRFPVYENSLDNVLGILHLKDLVNQQLDERPFDLRALLHDAPVVPENVLAENVLSLLKQQHVHMAVVIDEYGGTAGIVTMEDLIEEVMGDVRDEFDEAEETPIIEIEPGHLLIQGGVRLDELDDYVDLGEHDYDVETVGGLLLALINLPAKAGDEATVNGVRLQVEDVDGLSIEHLSVWFTPPEADEEASH